MSATLRKAASTVDWYCASACSRAATADRFLAASAPPSISGLDAALAPVVAPARPGLNSVPSDRALLLRPTPSVTCGSWLAIATPTCALAECRFGLGGAHVGPLLDQLRRQAERQVVRQLEVGELEALGDRRCWAGCRSGWPAGCAAAPAPSRAAAGWTRPARAPPAGWRRRRRGWRRGPDCLFRMPSVSRWAAMMRWVASTWPRSDASTMAAATTFEASDR